MKKKFFLATLLLGMALLFGGCGVGSGVQNGEEPEKAQGAKQTVEDDQVKLYCIEMTVASPNDAHVYSAKYPFHYFYVDKEDHSCHLVDMINKPSKVISREDFDVFAEYVKNMEEEKKNNPSGDDAAFTYSIYVSYFDANDDMDSMYLTGYDTFPEELNRVIDKFNALCGAQILSYPNEKVESDVDFLYQEFGYTDADYPREDMEAMLESPYVSLAKLISSTNTLAGYMDGYYTSLEVEKIKDKLPDGTETGQNVSMEELEQFAKVFAASLGAEWQVSESSKSSLLFDVRSGENAPLLVGRVVDIPSFSPDLQNPSIFIEDGPEGEGYNSAYVIDSTGNYFLAEYMRQEDFVPIVELFTAK